MELARLLKEESIEVAFKFLEKERPSAFERAKLQRQNARKELDAYLKWAEIKANGGEFDEARTEYEGLFKFDDKWPNLLRKYAEFLNEQSLQAYQHGLLSHAIADGELALRLADKLIGAEG